MVNLVAGLVALIAWVIFAFILKVGPGAIHLLLAAGATLLVRWWALRTTPSEAK